MPASNLSSPSKESTSTTKEEDALVTVVVSVIQLGLVTVATYYLSSYIRSQLREDALAKPGNSKAVQRLVQIMQRRGLRRLPDLNSYEQSMAEDVVDSADIEVEFKDVGGLDEIKVELWQLAVLPLKRPDLFANNSLVQPPKGILLYGKPGTG